MASENKTTTVAFDLSDPRASHIYALAVLLVGPLPKDVAEFLYHREYGLALHALADEVMKT